VVVLDHLATNTAARAELVLPVATYAEGDGTLVNNEGRAQRFFQVFVPAGDVRESWRWIAAAGAAAGRADFAWRNLDDVLAAIGEDEPELAPVRDAAPLSTFRVGGAKVARETHRSSGRTAMDADRSVHEPRPPDDPDSPLAFSMEGVDVAVPASLLTHIWQPNWNSVQALTRFQEEIGGPLRGGDPGVRLLSPTGEGPPTYFAERPGSAARGPGELRLVPLYHVFGSDELSSLSPPIAALAPEPYIALSPSDAAALGVAAGEAVALSLFGEPVRAPARILPTLPDGVAGVPVGVGGFGNRPLPRVARIVKP
jgi:NADH-quinone oxidoreductase subunit G